MRGALRVAANPHRAALRVSAVIERRPVVYPVEPWEAAYEAWKASSRAGGLGRAEPGRVLTLQHKTSGVGKARKGEAAPDAHSVHKTRLDLEHEFRALHRYNETPADREGRPDTLLRAYARRLYLLVGGPGQWRFPAAPLGSDDASLRQAAERAAREALAPFEPYMFGNAPIGHIGSDHFFFYGEICWLEGQRIPDVAQMAQPSVWVTRDELPNYLEGAELECCNRMLAKI